MEDIFISFAPFRWLVCARSSYSCGTQWVNLQNLKIKKTPKLKFEQNAVISVVTSHYSLLNLLDSEGWYLSKFATSSLVIYASMVADMILYSYVCLRLQKFSTSPFVYEYEYAITSTHNQNTRKAYIYLIHVCMHAYCIWIRNVRSKKIGSCHIKAAFFPTHTVLF